MADGRISTDDMCYWRIKYDTNWQTLQKLFRTIPMTAIFLLHMIQWWEVMDNPKTRHIQLFGTAIGKEDEEEKNRYWDPVHTETILRSLAFQAN